MPHSLPFIVPSPFLILRATEETYDMVLVSARKMVIGVDPDLYHDDQPTLRRLAQDHLQRPFFVSFMWSALIVLTL